MGLQALQWSSNGSLQKKKNSSESCLPATWMPSGERNNEPKRFNWSKQRRTKTAPNGRLEVFSRAKLRQTLPISPLAGNSKAGATSLPWSGSHRSLDCDNLTNNVLKALLVAIWKKIMSGLACTSAWCGCTFCKISNVSQSPPFYKVVLKW